MGDFQSRLEDAGIDSRAKTQRPNATNGLFSKDHLVVDLEADTVTCPADVTVSIRRHRDGGGMATFAGACTSCAIDAHCTNTKAGRSIAIGANGAVLARACQQDPRWVANHWTTRLPGHRATGSKVEHTIAHRMQRKHGGPTAPVRGRLNVATDFTLLAAAVNVASIGTLGACSTPTDGQAREAEEWPSGPRTAHHQPRTSPRREDRSQLFTARATTKPPPQRPPGINTRSAAKNTPQDTSHLDETRLDHDRYPRGPRLHPNTHSARPNRRRPPDLSGQFLSPPLAQVPLDAGRPHLVDPFANLGSELVHCLLDLR